MLTTKEKRAVPGKESASNLNTKFSNRQKNYSKQLLSFKPSDAKQTNRSYRKEENNNV
jgi:hypothetical protein